MFPGGAGNPVLRPVSIFNCTDGWMDSNHHVRTKVDNPERRPDCAGKSVRRDLPAVLPLNYSHHERARVSAWSPINNRVVTQASRPV